MEQSQGTFMKPIMVLSVQEGRVSGGLIAMATLDHSSSETPSHRVSTLVEGCSYRCRDDGACVRVKEGGGSSKVKATHLPEYRLYPAVLPL